MNGVCDRGDCPAHAYVTITFRTGSLEFCEHHARKVVSPVFFAAHYDNVTITREPVPA